MKDSNAVSIATLAITFDLNSVHYPTDSIYLYYKKSPDGYLVWNPHTQILKRFASFQDMITGCASDKHVYFTPASGTSAIKDIQESSLSHMDAISMDKLNIPTYPSTSDVGFLGLPRTVTFYLKPSTHRVFLHQLQKHSEYFRKTTEERIIKQYYENLNKPPKDYSEPIKELF